MRALSYLPTLLFLPSFLALLAALFSSRRDLVGLARAACLVFVAADIACLVGGALLRWRAFSMPGLLQPDRQRILAGAIDDAVYNTILTAITVAMAFQVDRRIRRGTADSWQPRLHRSAAPRRDSRSGPGDEQDK
jgi:hypothetical protein